MNLRNVGKHSLNDAASFRRHVAVCCVGHPLSAAPIMLWQGGPELTNGIHHSYLGLLK
jgi:hypothetical protein